MKKSPNYFVPGLLLDTSNFQELFSVEDRRENDNDSVYFDSDSEYNSSSESEIDDEESLPTEEVFFYYMVLKKYFCESIKSVLCLQILTLTLRTLL